MSGRSLIGGIDEAIFETDSDDFRFIIQTEDVAVLTQQFLQLPTYTQNGFLKTTGGDGTIETDTTLTADVVDLQNDVTSLDGRLTTAEGDIISNEGRITALEAVPEFDPLPITLDKINNRVGINNSTPQASLDITGGLRCSGASIFQNTLNVEEGCLVKTLAVQQFMTVDEITAGGECVFSGNVGIGSLSPSEKLDIVGNVKVSDTLKLTSYADGLLKTTNGTVGVDTTLEGRVASLESELPIDLLPITLNKTFNRVGINTPNPLYSLHVTGDVAISGQVIGATNLMRFPQAITGQKTTTTIAGGTNNDKFLRFRTGGGSPVGFAGIQFSLFDTSHVYVADVGHQGISFYGKEVLNATKGDIGDHIMTIKRTGNVGIGTTNPTFQLQLSTDAAAKPSTNTWTVSSDARLKEDIKTADYDQCYNVLSNLDLKYFKWRDDIEGLGQSNISDRHKLGWIAQEVEPLFPKAVETIPEMYGLSNIKTLNADQLYACMYGTIKKLMKEVEELKKNVRYAVSPQV
jgi:hypothetical protein